MTKKRCFKTLSTGAATPKKNLKSSKFSGLAASLTRPKDEDANELGNALRLLSDQRKKNEMLMEEQGPML
jgi:hypothetical protein